MDINIDSRVVKKEIKLKVFPFLKQNGFEEFSNRSAWRYYNNKFIHVISFSSFNSYRAENLWCTTFSFMVNIWIFIIWDKKNIKIKNDKFLPEEYECHLRNKLKRSFIQTTDKYSYSYECYLKEQIKNWTKKEDIIKMKPIFSNEDIWYISTNWKYLEESINDVIKQITEFAFPWFNKYSDLDTLDSILKYKYSIDDWTWEIWLLNFKQNLKFIVK